MNRNQNENITLLALLLAGFVLSCSHRLKHQANIVGGKPPFVVVEFRLAEPPEPSTTAESMEPVVMERIRHWLASVTPRQPLPSLVGARMPSITISFYRTVEEQRKTIIESYDIYRYSSETNEIVTESEINTLRKILGK